MSLTKHCALDCAKLCASDLIVISSDVMSVDIRGTLALNDNNDISKKDNI